MPKTHLSEAVTLHKLMPDMHESDLVQSSVQVNARKSGERLAKPKKREHAMADYALRVANLFESNRAGTRERAYEAAINKLLIDPDDIPESYWQQQAQIARDNGNGGHEIDEYDKIDIVKQIRDAQRTGAEGWANYLEQTGDQYPTWFKIYAWDGMSRLGVFDKQKGKYRKRDASTTAPYPQLNPAALAKVYSKLKGYYTKGKLTPDEPEATLIKNGNFNNLYSHFLLDQKAIIPTPENPEDVHGEWHEYTRDDIKQITEAAEGTPWCIAGEDMAASYTANGGKFHLFHLTDPETGVPSPTACASVRMDGRGKVAEISGLEGGSNQYLEDALVPTVEEKVRQLPGGEKYLRAFADKQALIAMDKKFQAHEEFTLEELELLYEVDRKIEYIDTYSNDPRPEEFKDRDREKHEAVLRQKYSPLETRILVDLQSIAPAHVDGYIADGVSGKIILSKLGDAGVVECMDKLLSMDGVTIEMIVGRMRPVDIADHLAILEELGATVDVNDLIENLHPVEIVRTLPSLLERGAHIDIDKFERRLDSYTRMDYIGNLIAAGANIDLATVVEWNGAENTLRNLDEVIRVGARVDVNKLVEDMEDVTKIGRYMDALLRNNADPNKIWRRLLNSRYPEIALNDMQQLADAGASINISTVMARLEPYQIVGHIDMLRRFGAEIDANKVAEDLDDLTIGYLGELIDAGADLDLKAIIKSSNYRAVSQNIKELIESYELDADEVLDALPALTGSRSETFGLTGLISELLHYGVDREKLKQKFHLTDEQVSRYEKNVDSLLGLDRRRR